MRRTIVITTLIALAPVFLALPRAEAGTDSSCSTGVSGDFNNDGYKDLAIGAPAGDVFSTKNAGVVNVMYGSASGIDNTGAQLWFQGPAGSVGAGTLPGKPENGDKFGACLAAGDFNNDAKDDLAIGVFGDNVGTEAHAGAVQVLYGSTATGLTTTINQLWTQASVGMVDKPKAGDHFGSALAVGDFNGDGFDDLAIGVPGKTVAGQGHAGAVDAIYGAGGGLNSSGNQLWEQGTTPSGKLQGHVETDDRFGSALAAGDFGGVGRDALAIGVPGEDVYGHNINEGVVQIVYSNTTQGLKPYANEVWLLDSKNVKGVTQNGDAYGSSLASGDFNKDGAEDLAIGIPFKDVASTFTDAGSVSVMYGDLTTGKLGTTNNKIWSQNTATMQDSSETGDHFGATLTSGDFNGDTFNDLAIGVPLENLTAKDDGAVSVIYGSATGLDDATVPNQLWQQGAPNAGDTGEDGDHFGAALATGDYNNDTFNDLAVGLPGEDHGKAGQGAVIVLDGTGTGITKVGRKNLDQDKPGIPGTAQPGDQWGGALG